MKKNNNNGKTHKVIIAAETPDTSDSSDITEAVTGEFKILDIDVAPAAQSSTPSAPQTDDARPGEEKKAAFWLSHLESEIGRLHEKWHGIDAEFKAREALIAELREIIRARDAAIEKLGGDVRQATEAREAAQRQIAARDAEIAGLVTDQRVRDERIATLLSDAAAQAQRHQELERQAAAVQTDLARSNAQLRQVEATAASLAKHNEDLGADKRELQIKIQDLETYIDGRKGQWSEIHQRLDDYKSGAVAMERTLGEREAALARHDHEKQQLAARIHDLEQQCAEQSGRRKEREAAYEELQAKLQRHIEAAEQTKAEHAKNANELEQALARLADGQKLIDSLEGGIALRDENLAALAAELANKDGVVRDLTARLEQEAAQAAAARDHAVAEAHKAGAELAARQHVIAGLEAEVRAKQAAVDLLERNVGRLTELGASLAALDRQMEAHDEPGFELVDFAATVASDSAPSPEGAGAMLSSESFMGLGEAEPDSDVDSPNARRFILLSESGDRLDYRLVKEDMTIGRGRDSDIRIASQFISRIHARVSTHGGATVIEDAGSKNGILVNSQRVKRRVLRNGDIVSLGGELDMKFVDASH